MPHFCKSAFAFAALGLSAAPVFAGTTIDQSVPVANLAYGINNGSIAVGQTITAPTDRYLTSFGLSQGNFGQVEFIFHFASWNGATPGADLFTSAAFLSPTVPTDHVLYTFTPPGGSLALTPGQMYVGYFTGVTDPRYTAGTDSPLSYTTAFTNPLGTSYTGGDFVHNDVGNSWITYNAGDAVFRATFVTAVPTPEPSSLAAFGFTTLGVGGLMLRARKRKA